ncbi:hypothetical protein FACS189430_05200 [Bacteroidia bacterium]|nr:hypothetical protein FACS189430_05200 [Bacteroidia bacterium]
MKKVFLYIVLGLLIATPYSCEEDPEKEPDVIVDPEDPKEPVDPTDPNEALLVIVENDAEAYALGNAVYPFLQSLSSSFSFLIELNTESTISFEGDELRGAPVISRLEQAPKTGHDNPHDYPSKAWDKLYSSIGASNVALGKLVSTKVTAKLTESTKKTVIARVKFTRALSYLYLVQLYGEVPLKLTTADAAKTSLASIDEIYTQIVKDLTEAEADLPEYDPNKANPSKGAANAILARTYLIWGQNPLTKAQVEAIKNDRTDPAHTVNAERLQKAVEYADKVIDGGQYELLEDFNRNFGVAGENGAEHIFTIHHDGDGVDAGQSNHQTHCTFTNRFTAPEADWHIGPADETVIDRFDDADKRKLLSYAIDLYNTDEDNKKYTWGFPVNSPLYGKWIHRSGYATTPTTSATTGIVTPASILRAGGSVAAQPNNINRIEIRYAEVLLIKAEALLFLNKASEGLPLVNQLRQRAGVPALTALTKEALFAEWELELLFEQKHWTNLIRWKTYIATILTVENFEYYKSDYKDEVSIKAKAVERGYNAEEVNVPFYAKVYTHLRAKHANVKGKFYRYPLPTLTAQDVIDANGNNPGY